MVAEMVVDGKTREGAAAVFQCALMYTRSDGIRVLRIHTVSLPTTPKLPEVSGAAHALQARCCPAVCAGGFAYAVHRWLREGGAVPRVTP